MGMMIHRRRQKMASALKAVEDTVKAREEKPDECVAHEEKSTLTAEDIEKLPFFSLKALALQHGIDVNDKKAKQLRRELLEKLKEE